MIDCYHNQINKGETVMEIFEGVTVKEVLTTAGGGLLIAAMFYVCTIGVFVI